MYERFVARRAEEALSDNPVVLIVGPRRAGKTTLVRKMGDAGRTYITLDDQTTLDAAQSDPVGCRGIARWSVRRSLESAFWLTAPYRSSRLPDLPPGCEFRGADSIAGEIAFVQANQFGLGDLGKTLAVARVDLLL